MDSRERTQLAGADPIHVRVERGRVRKAPKHFLYNFKIGRGEHCDIQFDEMQVSTNHAEVTWEDGHWWIHDLGSKNGTYINGQRVDRVELTSPTKITLASSGPVIAFEVEGQEDKTQLSQPSGHTGHAEDKKGMAQLAQHYFGEASREPAGERTRFIRAAFQTEVKKRSKRLEITVGIVLVLLIGALVGLYVQHQRVKKLQDLQDTAIAFYYSMKSLEMEIAKAQSVDRGLARQFAEKRRLAETFARDELGITKEKMSEEDWLIYTIARRFGECDVNMPNGFKLRVKEYIQKWQSNGGKRFRDALARAEKNDYTSRIVKVFRENSMPPEYFYLAMKESDFDPSEVGPLTRKYGYAKGMWQFIAMTGSHYGLHIGPLSHLASYDPGDERHDFEKSTRAAARYIRDLYQTEAKGSGLLVMACYNWGEDRVLDRVMLMPTDPQERNFWKLLEIADIPQQTYDYVFYIVSAAVIGENPRLFGFDFDNPLKPYLE